MAERPTGTVTFLFTDIEGSTRLLQQLGSAYREVLAEEVQDPSAGVVRGLRLVPVVQDGSENGEQCW